jgi:hypothetical protein
MISSYPHHSLEELKLSFTRTVQPFGFFFFLVVLEFELRASSLLGRTSSLLDSLHQPFFVLGLMNHLPRADFELQSS